MGYLRDLENRMSESDRLRLFGVCNLTTVCVTHNTPSGNDLLNFTIQRTSSSDYAYAANVRVETTVVTDISCHYA